MQLLSAMSYHKKPIIFCALTTLLGYFVVMDIILYRTVQSVNLAYETREEGERWSPFHPMSVKLIMQDHVTHYIITPISEYLNDVTNFSHVFYFITPNMITFTHLATACVGAKFVYSDSLYRRRIGVVLFELRTFLDAFDGTVYRARAANKLYISDHSNLGFWVDSTCDCLGGILLCLSVLFGLWWSYPPKKDKPALPSWNSNSDDELKSKNGIATETHATRANGGYSRLFIFWRVCCYGGISISLASSMWDQTVERYKTVFMVKMPTDELTAIQADALHSWGMWVIFEAWRVFEGQTLLQYILVAIFIDKIWEFLRFVQYILIVIIVSLIIISYIHYLHIYELLHIDKGQ